MTSTKLPNLFHGEKFANAKNSQNFAVYLEGRIDVDAYFSFNSFRTAQVLERALKRIHLGRGGRAAAVSSRGRTSAQDHLDLREQGCR